MRPQSAALLVAALAGVVVLAGCGGSDSTTGASSETMTKSQFVAKANAICAQGNKDINAAGKKIFTQSQAPSQAALQKFATNTVIPNIQSQIDKIDALTPPSGDEEQVSAIVDAAQSGVDKAKANPSVITQQSGSQNDPFAQADKLANAYGLTKCGSG